MKVKFDGYNEQLLTFECTSNVVVGAPVKMVGFETVTVCSEGDEFIGICRGVRDGFASIQVAGYVEVPYTGSITFGNLILAADGSGGVKIADTGTSYWAVTADTTKKTVGILV